MKKSEQKQQTKGECKRKKKRKAETTNGTKNETENSKMADVANTQDFEGHRGTVAMFLDSLLQLQGWGLVPAWRVLVEVRVVEPLRMSQPSTGGKGQTTGIENRPESYQDQPAQAPHPRRGKKSATCRPTKTPRTIHSKDGQGKRQGPAAKTQPIDTGP